MNINDVEETQDIPDTFEDIIRAIFAKQREVAIKYQEIEDMGNLLEDDQRAINVDTAVGQKWIKDFAWRVTEEIAEALEAWDYAKSIEDDVDLKENYFEAIKHYKEEMIDALHFLTELTIIAGYDGSFVELITGRVLPVADTEWDVVYQLGLMCNCLKNKPWKQTQMLTDRVKFEGYLVDAWIQMLANLYKRVGYPEDIYQFYFKKNEVNKFRIRSKY